MESTVAAAHGAIGLPPPSIGALSVSPPPPLAAPPHSGTPSREGQTNWLTVQICCSSAGSLTVSRPLRGS